MKKSIRTSLILLLVVFTTNSFALLNPAICPKILTCKSAMQCEGISANDWRFEGDTPWDQRQVILLDKIDAASTHNGKFQLVCHYNHQKGGTKKGDPAGILVTVLSYYLVGDWNYYHHSPAECFSPNRNDCIGIITNK